MLTNSLNISSFIHGFYSQPENKYNIDTVKIIYSKTQPYQLYQIFH